MSQHSLFRSLDSLCRTIVVSLRAIIVLYVTVSLIDTVGGLYYPSFANPHVEFGTQGEFALGMVEVALGFVAAILHVVVAISVWRFMYRANSNLRARGVSGLQFTPGWCIGWWMVPIASLFQPRAAMVELFQASSQPGDSGWRRLDPPPAMNFWWACWLIGTVVARMETRLGVKYDLGLSAIPLSWASTAILGASAFYLIAVVSTIKDLQNRNVADFVLPSGPVGDAPALGE